MVVQDSSALADSTGPQDGKSAWDEWRAGWGTVVSGVFGQALNTVPVYAMGSFIVPIQRDTGWARGTITAGMLILCVVILVTAPLVGRLLDRYGARRVGIVGAACHCCGIALLGYCGSSVWLWLAGWVVVSTTLAFSQLTIWTKAIVSQFDRGRGIAMAITLCGSGVGSALSPLLASSLIEWLGWQWAYPALGLIGLLVVVPLLVLLFHDSAPIAGTRAASPAAPGALPPRRIGGLLRSTTFLRLVGVVICGTTPVMAVTVNFVAIAASAGTATVQAASIAGIIGIAAIVSRLAAGSLLSRISAVHINSSTLLFAAATCALAAAKAPTLAILLALALAAGISTGTQAQNVLYLVSRRFPTATYGTVATSLSGVLALAGGLGPFVGASIFDLTGAYTDLFIGSAVSLTVAAALMFSLDARDQAT